MRSGGARVRRILVHLDATSHGVPSSHGCLGVALDVEALLYQFVSPHTPIYLHDRFKSKHRPPSRVATETRDKATEPQVLSS